MSGMQDGEEQGEKRPHEMLNMDNPAKRQRVNEDPPPLQHEAMEQTALEEHQRTPKPSPSGKQSMRCQVCIRAKKGGCGTEKAVYRCLRRPGGPRAASAGNGYRNDSKEDTRKKAKRDDGVWLSANTRVHAKFNGSWHTGVIRRVHRHKTTPYGIKLDDDKDNNNLLWVVRSCAFKEGSAVPQDFIEGETEGRKEDEAISAEEESKARLVAQQLQANPLMSLPPEVAYNVLQQIHPGKFQAVVRDAQTGGVKLCRKCNQPALPGNYGFCAMHRQPRSRGAGKDGHTMGGQQMRSFPFPGGFPFSGAAAGTILHRILQAQQAAAAAAGGVAISAATSPAAAQGTHVGVVPSIMAGMPAFPFPPQTAPDGTPIATATAAPPHPMMLPLPPPPPNMPRGSNDIPVVYGTTVTGDFIPPGIPSTTATAMAEAQAEIVPVSVSGAAGTSAESTDMKVPTAEAKPVEIQAAVPSDVVKLETPDGKGGYDIYSMNSIFSGKPQQQ
mmetsp:Transcript_28095/g.39243  ORF Transcript_28095/g.39243 Transcript_28095/m.39243 type:complete len:498 (+) Transcript_28095:86-1579(+)